LSLGAIRPTCSPVAEASTCDWEDGRSGNLRQSGITLNLAAKSTEARLPLIIGYLSSCNVCLLQAPVASESRQHRPAQPKRDMHDARLRFLLRRSPLFSNTFSIGALSGRTSAISSQSPAPRAIAARWRSSGDGDLRSLVARLCEAEMRRRNLSTSAVTAGGQQEAKDGGVDARLGPVRRVPWSFATASTRRPRIVGDAADMGSVRRHAHSAASGQGAQSRCDSYRRAPQGRARRAPAPKARKRDFAQHLRRPLDR
jgi:hypothetical protein